MEEEYKGVIVSTVYISYSNLIRFIALNVHVYRSEYSHVTSVCMGQKNERCLELPVPLHYCPLEGKALI